MIVAPNLNDLGVCSIFPPKIELKTKDRSFDTLEGVVWFLCFNGISTVVSYLMPNHFWKKDSSCTELLEDEGVHTFPKSFSLIVDIIARLEFELTPMFVSSSFASMPREVPAIVEEV